MGRGALDAPRFGVPAPGDRRYDRGVAARNLPEHPEAAPPFAEAPESVIPRSAPIPSIRPSMLPPGDPTRDLGAALHEVSNALTVVLGWIERARGALDEPGEVERALDIASSRAAQARGIVRRAIGAETGPEPQALVAFLVEDALTGIEPEVKRAGLTASGHTAPDVAERMIANAPTVLQILTNLLLNATAMAPRGSVVRVEAQAAAAGRVLLSVVDEGPGIAPERRGTLFESGLSTRAGGAGIGLRHAAKLARTLGGQLSLAESATGARFDLLWPEAALEPAENEALPVHVSIVPPAAPVSVRVRRALPLEGQRVLLVEDDDAVVDLLDTALTARGADVVSIRRQSELAAALATGPFDAALFDISPIQDDVCGALASTRLSSESVRVVLISGSAQQMPALPDDWVSAWVRKPFEVSEILQAIAPAPAPLAAPQPKA
jgi:CheY-like chemotaxis protein